MPLYEYICLDCQVQFELLKPMIKADEPTICLNCQGGNTHRKISVFNAQSNGKSITDKQRGGCNGCSGGTCSSCDH